MSYHRSQVDARQPQLGTAARRRTRDPGQRRAQVALDVVDQRLERRDVDDAGAGPGGRLGPRLSVGPRMRQPVQGVQEGGERLAAPCGCAQQRVLARVDTGPAESLYLMGARNASLNTAGWGAEDCMLQRTLCSLSGLRSHRKAPAGGLRCGGRPYRCPRSAT